MTVKELRDELFRLQDQDQEITVSDTNGWRYDFYVSDDGYLTIEPLADTKREDDEG